MKATAQILRYARVCIVGLAVFLASILAAPLTVLAQTPEPVVAVHVSELTKALETMPNGWWTSWHYFVMPESLKESLRSDGTPFVEVSDADIAVGRLRYPDGTPRYPILISLASEAVADNEIAPLRDYVAAGGFLFVGSSAFTRNPDGTTRGDFALAGELGMHMVHPTLQNWYENLHFAKVVDHRLVTHVPDGTLAWRMPHDSAQIPDGVSPGHSIHGNHSVFQVSVSNGTTVIANGDSGPLLATRQYGSGNFIYHGAAQPLIGHGEYDPAMHAYLIYRHAIEWAFEAASLPIIKLSPWRYDYDAAFIVRHDFENDATLIRSIESSASFEKSVGAKGDYYFCTGTLRQQMSDRTTVVASIKRAVTNSGATIGSHNGGLKNPVVSLSISDFDYWHWGPDEALDVTPPGYASGKAYAQSSLSKSFTDIEGWLAGTDNGRTGCGSAGNCPRSWVSPYCNSTREDSYGILEALGAVSVGEQKISSFPHWTLSYETSGKRYSHISLPISDWYVGVEVPGALEWGYTTASMQAAVDFYHSLGAFLNFYGHEVSSDTTLRGQYVRYCAAKPRMWAANAVGISDWWMARSNAVVTPAYSVDGNTATAQVTITGATDSGTSIEVAIPSVNNQGVGNLQQVLINGVPANPSDYRTVGNTVKVRVGASASSATVQYSISSVINPVPTTTSLSPVSATAGGSAFILTVIGTGFINGSVVQWNGSSRTTTYVSATQLTAVITAADIATTGIAMVTVFAPTPGGGTSNAQTFTINNSPSGTWTQTNWIGGSGQTIWSDSTRYSSASGINTSVSGLISLSTVSTVLFSSDFTAGSLSPWLISMGTWTITGGVLQGYTTQSWTESFAYVSPTPQWTDYMVQGSIQIPAGSFGGGIGGRLNPATGAHYGAWVYPAGSLGGSNVLKLWKFPSWTGISDTSVPMQQVSLSAVGTGWHTLQLTFKGNRIQVYYDGVLKIDVTDSNYNSTPAFLSGGISVDWEGGSQSYKISVDNISVTTPQTYGSSGTLLSSAYDGGDGAQWQTVSWDATAGNNTNVCVQTRAADSSDQLAAASWSNCYSASGSGFMSENRRWIQYQLALTTSDTSTSPVFNEIRTSYLVGSSGAPIPAITSLVPPSATVGGSDFLLTINGTNFLSGSMVRWNGVDRVTTYVSATQLIAAITASDIAAAGTASVTVFNPSPGGGTSSARTFLINNPVPTTTSLSPGSATAGGPAFTLTVNGTGFINGSTVQWNGVTRTTTYVSSAQLTAAILAADISTAGTASVSVFTPAPGGGTSNIQIFTINEIPVPIISSLNPSSQTAGGAAFTLTVSGNNFAADSVVQWNGSNRTTTIVSSTQLTAAILASDIATAGTAMVTVFNPTQNGGTSVARIFTINNPIPAMTGLSPASATAGGAAFTLTVNGTSFINGSMVQWNGSYRVTTFVSSTQLTAAIPASDIATAGTATVTAFTPVPGGGTSNSQVFTINVANNPVPATTGLSPASATAGGAAFTLTVNGTGFVNGSVVRWNGSSRMTTYVNATQLTAAISTADIATAGTATVTVFTSTPGGGTSNVQTFTINVANNPVPTTTSLSPTSATAGGSAFTLTVNGTGFINGSTVQWKGSNRTTTYVSATQLTASISAADIATTGTATVTVFTPAPGGGTSNAQTFTINASGTVLFSDDFTRTALSPWVASIGTWAITGGVLQGYTTQSWTESFAYVSPTPQWTDYTVQGSIQIPASSFGGGIGGRLNPATGAHYGAWVYPTGSPGGSNVLKLWKFPSWTGISDTSVPMQQISLPTVGTGWHTLQLTFKGNRIQVYYDGALKIDVTDNNYNSTPAFLSGGISVDWEGGSQSYKISVDNISVVSQ